MLCLRAVMGYLWLVCRSYYRKHSNKAMCLQEFIWGEGQKLMFISRFCFITVSLIPMPYY